jgi:hypothetical protein
LEFKGYGEISRKSKEDVRESQKRPLICRR